MNAQLNTDATSTEIAEYSPTAAALADLRHRFSGVVFDVTTTKGDKDARAARKELVTLRTSLEAKRKEIKAPALAYAKKIDDEAKRLTAEIEALELPIDEQIRAEESRKEAERAAKAEAERQRIALIQDRIANDITGAVRGAVGRSFSDISVILSDVGEIVIGDQFEEFQAQAQQAKSDALDKLREMQSEALAREQREAEEKAQREAEAARLAEERKELERLRAEEAERQRVAAEARAEEERAQAEKLAAERAAQEAELRARREAHERELAEQRAAQEKADAEARAAREAEERRIAAERAELERQQAAERERKRLEEEARDAAEKRLCDAAQAMADALLQWRNAEKSGDDEELKNARDSRDAALVLAGF